MYSSDEKRGLRGLKNSGNANLIRTEPEVKDYHSTVVVI